MALTIIKIGKTTCCKFLDNFTKLRCTKISAFFSGLFPIMFVVLNEACYFLLDDKESRYGILMQSFVGLWACITKHKNGHILACRSKARSLEHDNIRVSNVL